MNTFYTVCYVIDAQFFENYYFIIFMGTENKLSLNFDQFVLKNQIMENKLKT